ncbi:MAG: hypothetical protein HYT98_01125 [Candidatus Sungbacteria bacterium]|nr:hypothetical protein [Candidatus Sungbacteria bacterium]
MSEVMLQVQPRPEDIPMLKTDRSLVCLIDASGHVLAKRLDKESRRRDIEIEIFAPFTSAILVRGIVQGSVVESLLENVTEIGENPATSLTSLIVLTKRQRERINEILASLDRGKFPLNTLHIKQTSELNQYQRRTEFFTTKPRIKIPDCDRTVELNWFTDRDAELKTKLLGAKIKYEWHEGSFKIEDVPDHDILLSYRDNQKRPFSYYPSMFNAGLMSTYRWYESEDAVNSGFPYILPYAVEPRDRSFDMPKTDAYKRGIIPATLRVLYGEYELFEYFEIDDALLFLEEKRVNASGSELYWHLVVIYNSELREKISRVISNNRLYVKR